MNDAFDMGTLAATSGEDMTANPFDKDQQPEEWAAWVEGYESRAELDDEGEPLTD